MILRGRKVELLTVIGIQACLHRSRQNVPIGRLEQLQFSKYGL